MVTDTREMLLALEPRPESARLARRALHAHGLNEDIEHTVTLLATEIVSNAVRHAGLRTDQRIVFFARLNDDFARVEVADPGIGFDPDHVQTEGYGLKLLASSPAAGASTAPRAVACGSKSTAARVAPGASTATEHRKFLARRPFSAVAAMRRNPPSSR